MSNLLLVPMHLDALVLSEDTLAVGPVADFSSLPYFNGAEDVNPDTANVSEEIVSTPFENQNLLLKKGIHLHWALPDALTRAATDHEGLQDFPAVPNRWLITRRNAAGEEKQWIVESDFLATAEQRENAGSVIIPYRGDPRQPFRYLGRKLELSSWRENHAGADLKLTALGYGGPTFAAFYPNCHSVFGFFDPNPPDPRAGSTYDVIGWYSKSDQDCLKLFADVRTAKSIEQKKQDLEKEFNWTINILPDQEFPTEFPDRIVCFAQLAFDAGNTAPNLEGRCTIAVGNTGTEALSAYLAHMNPQPPLSNEKRQDVDTDEQAREQATIEDQLEALQLSARFEHRRLDIGAKFFEARHEKGFIAVPGGALWSIRSETQSGGRADASKTETDINLPEGLADKLNALNLQQQKHDQTLQEIESLRKQLFSDWYKYMLSAYPPDDSRDDYPNIDEVRSYIEFSIDDGLQKKTESAHAQQDQLNAAIAELRNKVAEYNQKLPARVKSAFTLKKISGPRYWQPTEPVVLIKGPAVKASERHGQDGRLRDDGLLETQVLEGVDLRALGNNVPDNEGNKEIAKPILEANRNLRDRGQKSIAFSTWSAPWNPLLLEWKVEVFPIENKSNLDPATGSYASDFINENYTLHENQPDLKETSKASPARAANVYGGRSILTPHAGIQLKQQIEAYLKRSSWLFAIDDIVSAKSLCARLRNPKDPFSTYWAGKKFAGKFAEGDLFDESKPMPEESELAKILVGQLNQLLSDSSLPGRTQAGTVLRADASEELKLAELMRANRRLIEDTYSGKDIYRAEIVQTSADTRQAYDRIRGSYDLINESEFLSQSLGGFNEALLMHKQTTQLLINDPLAFDDYQDFATKVRDAVEDSIYSAPQPLNDFNPICSGTLRILKLRLIDTFGQAVDLHPDEIIPSQPMASQKEVSAIRLAPRLVQPVRINFRWLAADFAPAKDTPEPVEDEQEMNDRPATTPICGWLLTNRLDNSLMVYDGAGKALGSIVPEVTETPEKKWHPAPGSDTKVEIRNSHLKKMVDYICGCDWKDQSTLPSGEDQRFLSRFISSIDNALENIEPENFAQHQDLALLMGRPIALVRASLNLQLQGLPAVHQGWNTFRQDLLRDTRDDNGFTKVQFPIRIGEYKQFNDGLVGYWREKGTGYEGDNFYALQSDESPHPHIRTHSSSATEMTLFQSVDSPLQLVSMLIDPRGVVHATSGILPVKAINIPPDQYVRALQAIEITFLIAPILTDAGKIHLPLPVEGGYQWSWVEDKGGQWSEVTAIGVIERELVLKRFGQSVWDELKDKLWISEINPDKASVTAKDRRSKKPLTAGLQDKLAEIEDMLDRSHLGPIDLTARFSGRQEIREGWLKLSADPTDRSSANGKAVDKSGQSATPGAKLPA